MIKIGLSRAAVLAVCCLLVGGLRFALAAETAAPPPPIDQKTILQASAFFNAGRLVEAEQLYRKILTAVDVGSLPTAELGRTLSPLVQIYRTWGRNEDALKMAERYRQFLTDSKTLDA